MVKKNIWVAERQKKTLRVFICPKPWQLWKYIIWNNKTNNNKTILHGERKKISSIDLLSHISQCQVQFPVYILCSTDIREIPIRSQSLASLKALLSVISNGNWPASLFRRALITVLWAHFGVSKAFQHEDEVSHLLQFQLSPGTLH